MFDSHIYCGVICQALTLILGMMLLHSGKIPRTIKYFGWRLETRVGHEPNRIYPTQYLLECWCMQYCIPQLPQKSIIIKILIIGMWVSIRWVKRTNVANIVMISESQYWFPFNFDLNPTIFPSNIQLVVSCLVYLCLYFLNVFIFFLFYPAPKIIYRHT